ncbi:MAG: L-seryl-tRNA(Sec) selenium transferase [Desulfocapsaceae bacterium]|nr:L-seryl-tRNA(Sec) selenium transferase [Desulfocapsaceae bacterium]
MNDKKDLLKNLPKVDECIGVLTVKFNNTVPIKLIKRAVQECIETERQHILNDTGNYQQKSDDDWQALFQAALQKRLQPNLRRVINGTGVVVHTNLGRSLLSADATLALAQAASHYTNLEFNLETGKRGSRYSLVENIICELTGAEAALVVNNNAAAVLLVLETLANGKEAIVSRGQLVEIGGSFRIPDVMKKSGVRLVEVGATNRTHLSDYETAISEETALLLKVHTSNFRMIGFTSEVPLADLVDLGRQRGILVMEDLGSGCLIDLSAYHLPKEPTVQEVISAGVDVVTFSGDKLLGGPQAGIIAGKREVIDKIKNNPLNRALRIDKFTLASLENIMRNYYDTNLAIQNIPTLTMLTVSPRLIKGKGRKLLRRLKTKLAPDCQVQLIPTVSRVGGGAMPEYSLPSWAIELQPEKISLNVLEKEFRRLTPPVIGRIENEGFLLDLRTIQEDEVIELAALLIGFFGAETASK